MPEDHARPVDRARWLVMRVQPWENLTMRSPAGLTLPVGLESPAAGLVGWIPAYDDYDAAARDFPAAAEAGQIVEVATSPGGINTVKT